MFSFISRKIISSSLALLIGLVIAVASFTSPAAASTAIDSQIQTYYVNPEIASFVSPEEASNELAKGVLQGFAGVISGMVSTVALCYAVDVLILPVNPSMAGYLAAVCPKLGMAVGGASGYEGSRKIVEALQH